MNSFLSFNWNAVCVVEFNCVFSSFMRKQAEHGFLLLISIVFFRFFMDCAENSNDETCNNFSYSTAHHF